MWTSKSGTKKSRGHDWEDSQFRSIISVNFKLVMNLGDTGELSYNWDERTRKYNPRRKKLEAHSGAVFQIKSSFAESKACWFCLLFFGNAHHCLLLWNSYPSPRQLSYVALKLLLATSVISFCSVETLTSLRVDTSQTLALCSFFLCCHALFTLRHMGSL